MKMPKVYLCYPPFSLRKLLEDVTQQNEGINQERGKQGPRNWKSNKYTGESYSDSYARGLKRACPDVAIYLNTRGKELMGTWLC